LSRRERRIFRVKLATFLDNALGLTDTIHPRRLGPKRVSKIRKLFAIPKVNNKEVKKSDELALVKKSAVRRTWTSASGKQR